MQPESIEQPLGDAPPYTAPAFRGLPQHAQQTTPCAVYKPSAPPAVSITAQLEPQDPRASHYAQQWVQAVADAKQSTTPKTMPPPGLVLPPQPVHAPTLHFSYQPRLGTLHDASYRALLATTAIPPCDGMMQPRQHHQSAVSTPPARGADTPSLLPHLSNPAARQLCDVRALLGSVVDDGAASVDGTTSMRLAPPAISVGYQLWDKAGLQPYAPPKGVQYLVIAPEGQQLRVRRYMQGLQSVFEGSGLGMHAVAEGQQPPYAIWEYVPWAASEHAAEQHHTQPHTAAGSNGGAHHHAYPHAVPRSRTGTPAPMGPTQSAAASPGQGLTVATPPLGRPSSRASQLPGAGEVGEHAPGLSLTDVAMRLQQQLLVNPPSLLYHTALASGSPCASLVVYAVPPSDHPSDVRDTLSVLLAHLAPLMQQPETAKAPPLGTVAPSPLTHPSPDPFSPSFAPSPLPTTPLGFMRSTSLPSVVPSSPAEAEEAVQATTAQAPSPAMHKYGAAAQQAYTLVTTPLAATASQNTTPPPPAQPLSLVLQLVGHGQLDDISGVSMYSTAHSVYLKCQPLVLQDMPECTLALCRPACVLAPTAQQQPVDSMPDDEPTPHHDPALHCCYQLLLGTVPAWLSPTAQGPGPTCWGLLALAWSDARGEALCAHCLPVTVPLGQEGPAGGPVVSEEALGGLAGDVHVAAPGRGDVHVAAPGRGDVHAAAPGRGDVHAAAPGRGDVQGVPLAQAVVRLSSRVYASLRRAAGQGQEGPPCRLMVERLGAMPDDEALQWRQLELNADSVPTLDSLIVVALTVPPLQRLGNPWDDCSGPHLTLPAASRHAPRSASVVWAPSPPSHSLLPGEVEVVRQLHVKLVHHTHVLQLQIATQPDTAAVVEAAGRLHALGTLSMVYQGMVLKQPMAPNGMGVGLAGYAGPLAHLPPHCLAVHTMASLLHDVMGHT